MKTNELIQLFRPIIVNGLLALGYPNVSVVQSFQPTQQGINNGPTVYFFKIYDHRYGFLKRQDTWDPISETMIHTETQGYETMFQVNALMTQNPANTSQIVVSDLVNECAQILQSDIAINALFEQDVQILRITDIRNPYFVDDRDRFEGIPSFDFVLTYSNVSVSTSPVVDLLQPGFYRV